jgi:hypothetical protein
LIQVDTKALNQQVKRNTSMLPERYIFQLTKDEYDCLWSQNVTLKRGKNLNFSTSIFDIKSKENGGG